MHRAMTLTAPHPCLWVDAADPGSYREFEFIRSMLVSVLQFALDVGLYRDCLRHC
jgi:hypothetical protein